LQLTQDVEHAATQSLRLFFLFLHGQQSLLFKLFLSEGGIRLLRGLLFVLFALSSRRSILLCLLLLLSRFLSSSLPEDFLGFLILREDLSTD